MRSNCEDIMHTLTWVGYQHGSDTSLQPKIQNISVSPSHRARMSNWLLWDLIAESQVGSVSAAQTPGHCPHCLAFDRISQNFVNQSEFSVGQFHLDTSFNTNISFYVYLQIQIEIVKSLWLSYIRDGCGEMGEMAAIACKYLSGVNDVWTQQVGCYALARGSQTNWIVPLMKYLDFDLTYKLSIIHSLSKHQQQTQINLTHCKESLQVSAFSSLLGLFWSPSRCLGFYN